MAKSPGTPKAKTGAPAQFDMNSRERKSGKGGPGGPGRGRDDKRPPSRIVNLPPTLVDRGEGWIIRKIGKIDQASHVAMGAEYQLIFEGYDPWCSTTWALPETAPKRHPRRTHRSRRLRPIRLKNLLPQKRRPMGSRRALSHLCRSGLGAVPRRVGSHPDTHKRSASWERRCRRDTAPHSALWRTRRDA